MPTKRTWSAWCGSTTAQCSLLEAATPPSSCGTWKRSTCGDRVVRSSFSFLETINAHKSNVCVLAFCPALDYLATAGRDSSINLWNTQSLRPDALSKRVVQTPSTHT